MAGNREHLGLGVTELEIKSRVGKSARYSSEGNVGLET